MSAVLRGRTLFLVCRHCKGEKAIAVGASALTLPEVKVRESAERVGWAVSEKTVEAVCPGCLGKPFKIKRKRTI